MLKEIEETKMPSDWITNQGGKDIGLTCITKLQRYMATWGGEYRQITFKNVDSNL